MSAEKFLHEGFLTKSRCLSGIFCLWRLTEVDGTCIKAEDSERCFCGAIAGVAEWWHREGGGGGGEGRDVRRTLRDPFYFVRSQGYIHGQADGH